MKKKALISKPLEGREALFRRKLMQIEQSRKADAVCLHGFLTNELVQCFFEEISRLANENMQAEKNLLVILNSTGAEFESLRFLCKEIYRRYDQLEVVIPYEALGASMILALSADKLWLDKNALVGNININESSLQSLELVNAGIDIYELPIEFKKGVSIDESLQITMPEGLTAQQSQSVKGQINLLMEIRKLLFSGLFKHHLSNLESSDREKKAIQLVNYFTDRTNFPTPSSYIRMPQLIALGALPNEYIDEIDGMVDYEILLHLVMNQVMVNGSGIQSLVQSRDNTIY